MTKKTQLTIGLTGSIGSGKSTVGALFAKLGANVIDADFIAREVTEAGSPVLKTIAEHFGSNIIDASGNLKRRHLRDLIFASATKRAWLEKLLHPLILARMLELAQQSQAPYCILMIPLLVEAGAQARVDRVLLVDAPEETCIARIMARDHVPQQQAEEMLASQATRQTRVKVADDIIHNTGSQEDLTEKVLALHQSYLALTKS